MLTGAPVLCVCEINLESIFFVKLRKCRGLYSWPWRGVQPDAGVSEKECELPHASASASRPSHSRQKRKSKRIEKRVKELVRAPTWSAHLVSALGQHFCRARRVHEVAVRFHH